MSSGLSRDLLLAQNAFEAKDAELSRRAHSSEHTKLLLKDEGHTKSFTKRSRYFFRGAALGLSSSLFTVCFLHGLNTHSRHSILSLGVSLLLFLSITFPTLDYIWEWSGLAFRKREYARERWELENYPEGEIQEMVELYTRKGIDEGDALEIIQIMSKYPGFFVNHMMVEELGILPPQDTDLLFTDSVHISFGLLCYGFPPLVVYMIDFPMNSAEFLTASAVLSLTLSLSIGFVLTQMCQWKSNKHIFIPSCFLLFSAFAGISWALGASFRK